MKHIEELCMDLAREIRNELCRKPDSYIYAFDYNLLPNETRFQTFAYGWYREDQYLYIGSTAKGKSRFASHHILPRLFSDDELHLWYCHNEPMARLLEAVLISRHRPLYNHDDPRLNTYSLDSRFEFGLAEFLIRTLK
jgi:hypothetical protein